MLQEDELRIGDFVMKKLAITEAQFKKFLNMQEYLNDRVGEIAVKESLVNKNELESILDFQKNNNSSFGVAAISLGILKSSQIKYLLDVQARNKHRIGELLVRQGIIKENDFLKLLDEFYSTKKIEFTILAFAGKETFARIQKVVKFFHHPLHACSDEKELIAAIKKTNPQLVFLDQGLEGDVLELSMKINTVMSNRKFKIGLLSPSGDMLEIIRGYEYGVDYILPAPLDPKHLINIIIDSEIHVARKRKELVLVVDDSPIVRKSIGEELKESGFKVLFAENGKEALEIAALEKPDLVTMDINMPVMDGYEACLRLKNNRITCAIPIIIVTTNNTREEREKGFEVGAVEYFTKPFAKGHLSNYIETLLFGVKKERPEKILIAEDSAICRNIYDSVLNRYGFQVKMVDNGQKIFDVLEKGFHPSVILLNSFMPGMDGFEVCLKLKGSGNYAHIPVIMVTAAKNKDDILGGLKAGANDYIIKPFDGDELVARIEAHVKNFNLLETVRKQNKDLAALNKLKDEYLSIVSHDIKSPLTNIVGFSEMLAESKSLSSEELGMLKIIKSSGQRTLSLVNELLSLREFETLDPALNLSSITLQDIIEEGIVSNQFFSDFKKILFVKEMPKKSIKIEADRSKILQVVNNLVANAIKFSHENGTIKIKVVPEKNKVVVSLQDFGVGIPKGDLKRIFDRFSKAARRGTKDERGTGLGLSISKKIVEMHHGAIWVESVESQGSAFSFSLPINLK
jgi:DNA-binding response OmpR family regulator